MDDPGSPFVFDGEGSKAETGIGVGFGHKGVGTELWTYFSVIRAVHDVEVVESVVIGAPGSRRRGPRDDVDAGLVAGARPVGTNDVPPSPSAVTALTEQRRHVTKGDVFRVVVRAVVEEGDYFDSISSVRLRLADGRVVAVPVPMTWCGADTPLPEAPGVCPFPEGAIGDVIDAANRDA